MPHAGEFATLQTLSFIAPTLLNSWVNFGAPHEDAGYLKDSNGFVHLKGLLKNGTSAAAVMFTLPLGYRPAGQSLFATMSFGAVARLDVKVNGDVGMISSGSTAYASIDGIVFKAA